MFILQDVYPFEHWPIYLKAVIYTLFLQKCSTLAKLALSQSVQGVAEDTAYVFGPWKPIPRVIGSTWLPGQELFSS